MVSTYDMWYLPRVKNLQREYKKCEAKLRELKEDFDTYLEMENADPYVLNVLNSRIADINDLMDGLEAQIQRLRLETLN